MKKLLMIYQCWLEVTKQRRYQDKWLTDETHFRAIKAQFPSLETIGFNRGIMNKAIATHGGCTLDDFTESNQIGRFRRKAFGLDPFGSTRQVWGYYVTAPGGLVERPPDGKNSFLSLLQDEIIQERYSVAARGIPEVVDLSRESRTCQQLMMKSLKL